MESTVKLSDIFKNNNVKIIIRIIIRKIPNIIWIDGLGNVQDNVNLILKEAELNEN